MLTLTEVAKQYNISYDRLSHCACRPELYKYLVNKSSLDRRTIEEKNINKFLKAFEKVGTQKKSRP